MYRPKVRKPYEKLVSYGMHLSDDPEGYGERILRIIKQEGYQNVLPALRCMENMYKDNYDCMCVLTMLRQPEWTWRDSAEYSKMKLVGIISDTGTFEARGYYLTGARETGEIVLYRPDSEIPEAEDEEVKDPRMLYESRKLKIKIYRKRPGKFFLVEVGRIVDFIKQGFRREELQETEGRGFFKKYQAYRYKDGPFNSADEARRYKDSS